MIPYYDQCISVVGTWTWLAVHLATMSITVTEREQDWDTRIRTLICLPPHDLGISACLLFFAQRLFEILLALSGLTIK